MGKIYLPLLAVVLFGAGCLSAGPGIPGFSKDASDFAQPATGKIPRQLPSPLPYPPPAEFVPPPATATDSGSARPATRAAAAPAAKPATAPTRNLSYTDAVKTYRTSGAYFQLVNCRGTPGTINLKKGVPFMIDNRDAKAHRVEVGGQAYQLKAYGFAIVTSQTIGINYITCDGSGAAGVNVQP
ncbi:MAG: hypothetical protein HYV42_04515 [Candidatus Magasanikbacteria bacterium]|nr:hypothetical protein [Candidatus Magasanikbacteria bacterium]